MWYIVLVLRLLEMGGWVYLTTEYKVIDKGGWHMCSGTNGRYPCTTNINLHGIRELWVVRSMLLSLG